MKTYQLQIKLKKDSLIKIGKLGEFTFPKGFYVYTGSAKRNIDARINRHTSKDKKMHWHIDYFLNNENAEIFRVCKFDSEECDLNQRGEGEVLISGFGSSDCKNKCRSHLKFLENRL